MNEGELLDAPNQQVVRADGSASWEEGTGGSEGPAAEPELTGLDAMSKEELLAEAQRLDLSPANNAMTKAELRAVIDAKLAGEPA